MIALLAASVLGLILVIGLVWAIVLGEERSRQLSLQFEVYRASANLTEAWLADPETPLIAGPIVGFGVYDEEGRSLEVQGSAPAFVAGKASLSISLSKGKGGSTLILTRPLSGGMLGQGVPGEARPGRMGGGRMMGDQRIAPFPPRPGTGRQRNPILTGPRTLWLEYAPEGNPLLRSLQIAGGILLSLVFLGLFALLWFLFRKNTELRDREAKNRELAELGEAARNLVHEIKNPLAIIGVQAATLRKREGEDSVAGRAALVIDGEVRRLARMADRIREFLKSGAQDAEPLELASFLEGFATRYQGGEGMAGTDSPTIVLADVAPHRGRAWTRIDSDRLSLALDNLVRNAFEADPAGKVDLQLVQHGKHWLVSVGDRGQGVPEANQGRLFEPFFTTKEKGSGIGLALARSIVRGAKGDLRYEDRPGGGASFILTLTGAALAPGH